MRLSGGQALAAALVGEGVECVFGLPGVQLDWAFDGLYEQRERVRVYHTRHEQATAYMADGYARTTGRVGVCLMVPGPGVLNAGAGLGNLMMTAELGARMDIIIVCATAVTLLGMGMSYGVNALSDHVLRWRGAR